MPCLSSRANQSSVTLVRFRSAVCSFAHADLSVTVASATVAAGSSEAGCREPPVDAVSSRLAARGS